MRYESEVLYDLMKRDGLLNPSQDNLPYESELKEKYVNDVVGAYPKLNDYRSEWLNYALENGVGEFPYVTLTDVTNATIDNVVPYAYKSAILKGNSEVVAGKNKCNMEEIQTGWLDGSSGEVVSNTGVYIPVKVSGTITISNFIHNKSRYVYEYDASGNYLGRNSVTTNTVTLSLNENTILIKMGFYDATLSVVKSLELQVEQGEVATEYEPYNSTLVSVKMPVLTTSNEDGTKSNILTTPEDLELRGIGDVKDTLDCLTGEVTERIGEIVLNENITGYHDTDYSVNGYSAFRVTLIANIPNGLRNVICDKVKYYPNINLNWTKQEEFFTVNGNLLFVKILSTKASNFEELRTFLSSSPITIQYPLETESIKTVDLTILDQNGDILSQIKPIEGTMNLSTSSDTIPPTFSGEIPVEAIEQNLASFADLEGVEHDG